MRRRKDYCLVIDDSFEVGKATPSAPNPSKGRRRPDNECSMASAIAVEGPTAKPGNNISFKAAKGRQRRKPAVSELPSLSTSSNESEEYIVENQKKDLANDVPLQRSTTSRGKKAQKSVPRRGIGDKVKKAAADIPPPPAPCRRPTRGSSVRDQRKEIEKLISTAVNEDTEQRLLTENNSRRPSPPKPPYNTSSTEEKSFHQPKATHGFISTPASAVRSAKESQQACKGPFLIEALSVAFGVPEDEVVKSVNLFGFDISAVRKHFVKRAITEYLREI